MLPLVHDPRLGARGECKLFGRNFDGRENGRVVVRDHQSGGGKPGRLVNQHVGTLVVAIIRDEKPRRERRCSYGILCVQRFEKLGGLDSLAPTTRRKGRTGHTFEPGAAHMSMT